MAKIAEGRGAAKNVESKKTTQPVEVPKNDNGTIDYVALYNKIDAEKTTKTAKNSSGVGAAQIREVIDGLFGAGKDEVKVATVEAMVNNIHGLKKEGDVDNRVQNASIRSAGEAGGKYIIDSTSGVALFKKNLDYKPKTV